MNDTVFLTAIDKLNAAFADLAKRVSALESPPTVGHAYTSPEGWAEKQRAVEAKCGTNKWRDAKTDPPVTGGHYIACFSHGCVKGLEFNGRNWLYSDTGEPINLSNITHWHELPKPPAATEPSK